MKNRNYFKDSFMLVIRRTLLYSLLTCCSVLYSQESDSIYLFSYFKNNGQDGLHLAHSNDGKTWKALKNDQPYLEPQLGNEKLMRDPCIIQGPDGLFHMVWTVGWTEKGIGYASSKDLKNWSEQQFIPVMEHEENARNCWAPEVTYDPKSENYIIYWATTIRGKFPETQIAMDDGYNHRIYYTLTKDFKTFSDTELLFEPGFNVIDATIKKTDDGYIMIYKDETREPVAKNLSLAKSDNLTGPYQLQGEPITGDYWAEGPTILNTDEGWVVYFDKYIEKQYGAVQSSDLEEWVDISEEINFPEGIRHGSIFKISRKQLEELDLL